MIRGFEEYTQPLTEGMIMNVVPKVAALLKYRKGAEFAITNKEIQRLLRHDNITVSDTQVRAIINYIRTNHIVKSILASSKGYYIATDVRELEDYCRSLGQRMNAIGEVRKALLEDTQGRLFL